MSVEGKGKERKDERRDENKEKKKREERMLGKSKKEG